MGIEEVECVVIGAGPAGLAAAEVMLAAGHRVVICEGKPSVARKFLMAGKSGLNLTKAESLDEILMSYGAGAAHLEPMLRAFDGDDVRAWAEGLGETLFTGSSGRVFPVSMKGSPLLRKWLARLDRAEIRTRWRWTGWQGDALTFETAQGQRTVRAQGVVLALGGASWPRLGSDGAWVEWMGDVPIHPFRPANMGIEIAWSEVMRARFSGRAIKGAVLRFGAHEVRGEFVISTYGIEGSAVYALSAPIRDALEAGEAMLHVDLFPDRSLNDLTQRLARPRGKASLSNHLRKTLGLTGARAALVHETGPVTPERLKAIPLAVRAVRPLAEAISSAGGIAWQGVSPDLMLNARPGVFVAGEMLDWEAPTGGYLLTASLATGRWAGDGAVRWLAQCQSV